MKYPSKSPTENGFTLIETLVAITILAISVTLIMELFSGSLRLMNRGHRFEEAVSLAQSQMDLAVAATDWETLVFEETLPDENMSWELVITDVTPGVVEGDDTAAKPFLHLYELAIIVRWPSGKADAPLKEYALTTRIARPYVEID